MIRINLLPVPKVRRLEKLIVHGVLGLVIIGAVMGACYLVTLGKKASLTAINGQIQQKEQMIRELQAQVGQVDQYKEKAKSLEAQLSVIRSLEKGRSGPVKLMDELTEIVPRRIFVTSVKETAKTLTMEGMAESGATVADFLDNLKTAKYFDDVKLEDITAQEASGHKLQRFKLTMRVKYDL